MALLVTDPGPVPAAAVAQGQVVRVPQVYLTSIDCCGLVAFDRPTLSVSERKTITIEIDERLFADWIDRGWAVKGGYSRLAIARLSDEGSRSARTLYPVTDGTSSEQIFWRGFAIPRLSPVAVEKIS